MSKDKPPITRKIGARRVRTEPVEGQTDEPTEGPDTMPVPHVATSDNDSRLKADKPPHY